MRVTAVENRFPEPSRHEFKTLFRRARLRSGLSRRDAAEALGVSVATLAGWEQEAALRSSPGCWAFMKAAALFRSPDMLAALLVSAGWPPDQVEQVLAALVAAGILQG
jgi:transcriptional regulator with XRE-family HTH domain